MAMPIELKSNTGDLRVPGGRLVDCAGHECLASRLPFFSQMLSGFHEVPGSDGNLPFVAWMKL